MAGTTFKIKQSAVAGKIPAAGSLVQGELALNTADHKLYSKDSSGTVFEIAAQAATVSYPAGSNVDVYEYSATAGDDTFNATYDASSSIIEVYYNGVKLLTTDYTALTGTNITLLTPVQTTGDEVVIVAINSLPLTASTNIRAIEVVATAGQTTFNIPAGYDTTDDIISIHINGVKILSTDYDATSGTDIILNTGAGAGDEVVIEITETFTAGKVVLRTGDTGSSVIPSGTTAQRDAVPGLGYFRWNTSLGHGEMYDGSTWQKISGQLAGEISYETFNGDDVTTQFTLADTVSNDKDVLVVVANVVQTPTTAYTVTGNQITFTSAPPTGALIQVRYFTAPLSAGEKSTSITAATVVDSFAAATYRTAEYTFSITGGTAGYQTNKLLVMHDGTNVDFTEYGNMLMGTTDVGSFSAAIVTGNVEITFTPAQAGTTVVKLQKELITV